MDPVPIILTICTAATPLLLAATGELVVERSGVLNLGVEGMMIVGAIAAFAVAQATGSAGGGLVGGAIAGAIFSSLFGLLVLTFRTNQVASGLALTILGLGVSGLAGASFTGVPGVRLGNLDVPILSDLPVIGPLLFGQDPVFYISLALLGGTSWFLFMTRRGLQLRAVGNDHASAHALGIDVLKIRYAAILFGGICAGLAGAQLSLVYVPQWIEGMTAGKGWIALALVVFASWRPWRLLIGAYLFGAVSIGQYHAQAFNIGLPSQLMSALPYIATIVVLVIITGNRRATMVNTPASLGQPFVPDR